MDHNLRKQILGLQPRDKAAMLVVKTKEIFLLNLHQNRVHFPAERNSFVLDHQHGRRDVACKPAISETFQVVSSCLQKINREATTTMATRTSRKSITCCELNCVAIIPTR